MKFDKSKMFVVSDFDRTITDEGKVQSWAVLDESGVLGQGYVEERKALYNKYRPLEIDPNLSEKKRCSYVVEWFEKHLELIVRKGLTKKQLDWVCRQSNLLKMRSGAKEFLVFLHENNIPLFIFSAGLADVIEGFLRINGLLFDNIVVVANRFKFDGDAAVGFEFRIIHSHNKKDICWTKEMKKRVKGRKQILLLGDSPADVDMVKKRKKPFKVAMKTTEREGDEQIKKNFDIVCDNFFEILELL